MYLADMYCYGKDPDAVGVTGISGCMGVFVSSGATLYGIHIPENNPDKCARGGKAFTDFIKLDAGNGFDGEKAVMITVANFTQRSTAADESYEICRQLGMRRFTLFRPEKHIAVSTGKNPESIWVVWQRVKGAEMELRYRPDANILPKKGEGTARSGDYGAYGEDARYTVSTEGWYAAKPPNAHGMRHHLCS
jgi:hypothetical protein